MTQDLNSSQSNTDGGFSLATDYQRKQQGDVISDVVMQEIVRRLILSIFESGFNDAIQTALNDIDIPDPGIDISSNTQNILRADPNGDVLLETDDVPHPAMQATTGNIGGAAVSPVTVNWPTAFPDTSYHLSVVPSNQIDGNGVYWVSKFADRVEIHFLNITADVALQIYGHDTKNRNP